MASQERNQYSSSILVNQSPIDSTEIVRVRLSQAKLLNDEFAKFFKNYQSIKSNYFNQLNRLIKDSQDLNKNIEHGIIENQVLSREELKHYNVDAIGHLSQIWGQIITEIKEEVSANYRLGQVIDRDVIGPLSQYTSKDKRWGEIRGLHAKLSEVAQTIEFNQEKLEKYQNSKNSEKFAKYDSALQSANQTWASEAPFVFESFEYTDFDRLSFLRDSLLRFQTAQSDVLNKALQSNERALETILNFNPETEISRFAKVSSETNYVPKEARKAAESPNVPQHEAGAPVGGASHGKSGSISHGAVAGSTPGNRQASVSTTATAQTQNNKHPTRRETASLSSKETKSKGNLKSKVGSIFGRKKNKNKNLAVSDTLPESETSSLASAPRTNNRLSRASSLASRLKTQPSGGNLAPKHQQDNISGQQAKGGSSGTAVGAAAAVGGAVAAGGAYAASHSSNQQPKPISKTSGPGQPQSHQYPSSLYQQQQPKPSGQQPPFAQSNSSGDVPLSLNQPPLKPTSRGNSSSNINGASPLSAKPLENQASGHDRRQSDRSYSDTNSSLNVQDQSSHEALPQQQPTTSQIQPQATDSYQDQRAPPPPPSRKTQQFGSQNLTNIREDADTSFGSAQGVQGGSTSHGSVPPPPPAGHQPSHTQRRDIQSGLFNNLNQADLENHQNKRVSSFNSFGGDSVRLNPQLTGSSLTLNHPGLFQHSALTQPGLNASIAEVINAKFKDGEQINSQIVGEIAFNYLSDGYDIPTRTNLKIHGSQQFDKIIPNNQFLKQIDHDEFEVTPHSILSRTLGGLKYLIKNSNAPLVVHPVWRFEPHQASVMLTIKLAPLIAEQLGADEAVEINELNVSVAVSDALTTGALSKPQGTFNKDKGRITWKFNDVLKLSATSEEKLVARFLTTSEAKESSQGVVLKFSINNENGGKFITSNVELESQNFTEDDPFAQEAWAPVPSAKTLVAGSYSALA